MIIGCGLKLGFCVEDVKEREREEENGAFPFVARGTLEGRGFSASSSSFSTLPRSL